MGSAPSAGPAVPVPAEPRPSGSALAAVVRFFRAHPVAALAILTPGIPEYLSGSSPINALVFNPAQFVFQIGLNLGLYLPGVLLVREAVVRWRKGWASLIVLGVAYGIVEEGIALSTLFNPHAGPVGALGFYGHFAGVSWVWLTGLLMFHSVFSVTIPVVLLGLAIPETSGHPLVGGRGLALALAIYVADVGVLFFAVLFGAHFWMGWPILLGSLAAVAFLVGVALRLPSGWPQLRPGPPSARPAALAIAGFSVFTGTLLIEAPGPALGVPAALIVAALVAFYGLLGRWVIRALGDRAHRRELVALITGALTPVGVLGFAAGLPTPLVLAGDVLLALFLLRLWRHTEPHLPGGPGPESAAPPSADLPAAGVEP